MSELFNLEGPLFKLLSRVVDIVLLNTLFLLFSLPIITVGASITALYSVTIKMVRHEDAYLFKSFVLSFKRNFVQVTIVWLIMLAAGLLFIVDFNLLENLSGVPRIFFTSLLIIFGFIYLCILLFIFPYMARFEDTIKKSLLNSLLVGLSNFPYLLLLLLLNVVPFIIVFSSSVGFVSGLYIGTFGGFAFFAFFNSYIFRKIFSKYDVSLSNSI